MLVACRLAGLSALEERYPGVKHARDSAARVAARPSERSVPGFVFSSVLHHRGRV